MKLVFFCCRLCVCVINNMKRNETKQMYSRMWMKLCIRLTNWLGLCVRNVCMWLNDLYVQFVVSILFFPNPCQTATAQQKKIKKQSSSITSIPPEIDPNASKCSLCSIAYGACVEIGPARLRLIVSCVMFSFQMLLLFVLFCFYFVATNFFPFRETCFVRLVFFCGCRLYSLALSLSLNCFFV